MRCEFINNIERIVRDIIVVYSPASSRLHSGLASQIDSTPLFHYVEWGWASDPSPPLHNKMGSGVWLERLDLALIEHQVEIL